jgi:hypothetical protein
VYTNIPINLVPRACPPDFLICILKNRAGKPWEWGPKKISSLCLFVLYLYYIICMCALCNLVINIIVTWLPSIFSLFVILGIVSVVNIIKTSYMYQARSKIENPWMSLNLKTKMQGLEWLGICKEVLESYWILLALVYGYFPDTYIKRTFCWIDFACSYLTKLFETH